MRALVERRLCPLFDWEEDPMTVSVVLDSAGRRRSPATLPGYHAGRAPRNKGMRYPADPPPVEEIIAVKRETPDDRHGWRLRALIVVLWRGRPRVQEAIPPPTAPTPAHPATKRASTQLTERMLRCTRLSSIPVG
jgi:hypothetical protein